MPEFNPLDYKQIKSLPLTDGGELRLFFNDRDVTDRLFTHKYRIVRTEAQGEVFYSFLFEGHSMQVMDFFYDLYRGALAHIAERIVTNDQLSEA
jgi:hypothetical protein